VAVVDFLDLGRDDPKWICSDGPLTAGQRAAVIVFFTIYARLKRLFALTERRSGPTCFRGITSIPK
jgi:inorganic pyrophosphatase